MPIVKVKPGERRPILAVRCKSAAPGDYSAYTTRDAIIHELGFDNYAEYLKSDLWYDIRRTAIASQGQCRICAHQGSLGNQLQPHHRKYTRANLRGENLEHIVVLCRKCHKRIEVENDIKLAPDEVERRISVWFSDWTCIDCGCPFRPDPHLLTRKCRQCAKRAMKRNAKGLKPYQPLNPDSLYMKVYFNSPGKKSSKHPCSACHRRRAKKGHVLCARCKRRKKDNARFAPTNCTAKASHGVDLRSGQGKSTDVNPG